LNSYLCKPLDLVIIPPAAVSVFEPLSTRRVKALDHCRVLLNKTLYRALTRWAYTNTHIITVYEYEYDTYRVYKKKRNLGISQEIDIVLKTKDFRRLGI
jgi:hypothetical protein